MDFVLKCVLLLKSKEFAVLNPVKFAVVGLASIAIAHSAMAQGSGIPTFDISTYTQMLNSIKQGAEQITHLQTQIQNQIQQLEYMKQNLNQFNFNDLNSIQNSISKLLTLQNNLDSLVKTYGVSGIEDYLSQFKTSDDLNKDTCLIGNCSAEEFKAYSENNYKDYSKKNAFSQGAYSNAMKSGELSVKESRESIENTKKILEKGQSAKGLMESQGALIELLAEQNKILARIENNMANMGIADSAYAKQMLEAEAKSEAYKRKMLGLPEQTK